MLRTFCLLSLILFTIDFPRDKFAQAEPIRVDSRDDHQDYRQDAGQAEGDVTRGRRDDENSSKLFGKWRNNGEALEPKWRDGDNVPLLPFSHYSRYSREELETSEDYENRQVLKYPNDDPEKHRSKNEDVSRSDYQVYDGRSELRGDAVTFFKPRDFENKDLTSTRYREAFQARPNDYEHEFNDEEYLKPRPRKRRPPQNYEFALAANEASLREQKTDLRPRTTDAKSAPKPEPKSGAEDVQLSRNAVELKSLLKMQQEEGLSLSEILQRRNLTLNDLLKGKADVISALKSKDVDDDYIEEASRVMSNSFLKISTEKPPRPPLESRPKKDDELLTAASSSGDKKFYKAEATTPKNLTNSQPAPSSVADRMKIYSETGSAVTGKSPLADRRAEATTPGSSTVVTANSMEYFQNDDGSLQLQQGRGTKSEKSDEDEIMEFSDFTDYKKGRNGASPVWLTLNEDEESTKSSVESPENARPDVGSTLSIEKILSPTQHTKVVDNSTNPAEGNRKLEVVVSDAKPGKMYVKPAVIVERPAEEYGAFLEQEYQDDAPPLARDVEYSTKISISTDMETTLMREIQSTLDAMSGRPGENRQATSTNAEVKNHNYSGENHRATSSDKRTYEEIISEIEPEARAEIFELFASGSAGKRLERLLKSRNMSLDELIALRQRGSSKVHLAEVSRIRTQKQNVGAGNESRAVSVKTSSFDGERVDELGKENVTSEQINENRKEEEKANEQLPESLFEANIDSSTNSVHLDESTTRSASSTQWSATNEDRSTPVNFSEDKQETLEDIPRRAMDIVDLLTTFGSLPFAREIQRDLTPDFSDEIRKKLPVQEETPKVVIINNDVETIRGNGSSNVIQSGYVEEIVKGDTNSVDIRTIFSETTSNLETEEGSLSRVKPSIIASGAILGVTIVVFLAIFIICRIRQKQKYRYRNTFSRAVFQGPMTAARKLSNSSSLSTVMVNVMATSTTKRPDRNEMEETMRDFEPRSDIDNDSLDANDSWETIPDYMK